jgi:hypothetical protein
LGIKFQYHAKDLCDNELIQESLFKMVFYGLFSSSCHHADAGFRKLRCEMVKMSGKHWLEIFDELLKQAQQNGSITIEKNMIVGIDNKVFEI